MAAFAYANAFLHDSLSSTLSHFISPDPDDQLYLLSSLFSS